MKKKVLFSAVAAVALSIASLSTLNANNQTRNLSDLELANIEALTDDESDNPVANCKWAAGFDERQVPCHYCLTTGTGSACTPCGTKEY